MSPETPESTPKKKPKFKRGENPASWAHAKFNQGRPKFENKWGEKSVTSGISISKTALNGLKTICKEAGYSGHSEFLQHVGMGLVPILSKDINYKAAIENLKEQGFESLEDLIIAISNGEVEIAQSSDEI
jgi:hypothetical protein